jgi:type VI secretion system protein ImpF
MRLRRCVGRGGRSSGFEGILDMPRTDNEVRITPSVLDRLIDYEPENSRELLSSRTKSLRHLKECVQRDLEWLLNTRQPTTELPRDMKELTNSVAAYGLPDFTAVSIKSSANQNRLRRALEAAISTFEPRLEDVRVTIEPIREGETALHFRIDARLRVEPAPEPITFDTVLRPGSGQCVVTEG